VTKFNSIYLFIYLPTFHVVFLDCLFILVACIPFVFDFRVLSLFKCCFNSYIESPSTLKPLAHVLKASELFSFAIPNRLPMHNLAQVSVLTH
jgi:hypothetical protein